MERNGKKFAAITCEQHKSMVQSSLPAGSLIYVDENPDVRRFLSEQASMGTDVVVIDDDGLPFKEENERDLENFQASQAGANKVQLIFVPSRERVPGDPFMARIIAVGLYSIVDPVNGQPLKEEIASMVNRPRGFGDVSGWLVSAEGRKAAKRRSSGLMGSLFGKKRSAEPSETPSATFEEGEIVEYVPKRDAAPSPERIPESDPSPTYQAQRGAYIPAPHEAAPSIGVPIGKGNRGAGEAPAYVPGGTDSSVEALRRKIEAARGKVESATAEQASSLECAEPDIIDAEPVRDATANPEATQRPDSIAHASSAAHPEPKPFQSPDEDVIERIKADIEAKFALKLEEHAEQVESEMAAHLIRAGVDPDLAKLRHSMCFASAVADRTSASAAVESSLWAASMAKGEDVCCMLHDEQVHSGLAESMGFKPGEPFSFGSVAFPLPGQAMPRHGRIFCDLGPVSEIPEDDERVTKADHLVLTAPTERWDIPAARKAVAAISAERGWAVCYRNGQQEFAESLSLPFPEQVAVPAPRLGSDSPSDMSPIAGRMLPKRLSSPEKECSAQSQGAAPQPVRVTSAGGYGALLSPDGSESTEFVELGPDFDALAESHRGWAHAKGATLEAARRAMDKKRMEKARKSAAKAATAQGDETGQPQQAEPAGTEPGARMWADFLKSGTEPAKEA